MIPWRRQSPPRARAVFLTTVCAGAVAILAGCGAELGDRPQRWQDKVVADADATRGRALVASGEFGCPACHAVPGIRHARGIVGPSLDAFGDRTFIAGTLPNRPGHLIRYLQDPPAFTPQTAMPAVGLSPEQTRDIAAYLYTLRGPYAEGYHAAD